MPDPNQPLSSTPKPLGDTNPTTNVPPVVVEEKPPVPPIGNMPPPPPVPSPIVGNIPPPPRTMGQPEPLKKPEKSVLEPAPDKKDKKTDKKVEPTIFPPGGKPKKKKGKIIATILVLLVLVVGGVSATILVRQQQDIREEASGCDASVVGDCGSDGGCSTGERCMKIGPQYICESDSTCEEQPPPPPPPPPPLTCAEVPGASCVLSDYSCQNEYPEASCSGSKKCGKNCTAPPPPPPPPNGNGCTDPGSDSRVGTISGGISVEVTQAMVDYCICEGKSGKIKVSRFQCSGQTMPAGGCTSGGQITYFGPGSLNTELSATQSMANDCGPQQLDVGCVGGGNIQYVSGVNWPAKCDNGGNGNGGNGGTTLTCQCIEIKAFDSEDTELTAEDLANLAVGDVVKFAVRGSSSDNAITKARFTINGTLRTEITGKQNINTVPYYVDTYTIPEGVTSFTIKAELYHPTALWF